MLDHETFRSWFEELTGNRPYDYQVRVAETLAGGDDIVLRAPTGAGKTWAVLAPFFYSGWQRRPTRLLYALPLRTLAQGIYHQARDAAARLGLPVEAQRDAHGREVITPFVTLQTGEDPDDRFFDRGTIVITTYDQLLSGLLDAPYGLSQQLHNINAAAVLGALVVFDEFHLMEPHLAFLTAIAGLRLFRGLCQSVWMTATATQPLEAMLQSGLGATVIPDTDAAWDALVRSLPSVTRVHRQLTPESNPLSADVVLRCHQNRSIVLLNTVGRAQEMFAALQQGVREEQLPIEVMLLHSRFFKQHRRAKEARLRSRFGKEHLGSAILVATQVIEAGLDTSQEDIERLCLVARRYRARDVILSEWKRRKSFNFFRLKHSLFNGGRHPTIDRATAWEPLSDIAEVFR